jgi:hypothetical protein
MKFDYIQKLVKPEVNVMSGGQKMDLSKLFTEGRTGILMGCISAIANVAVNQDFIEEAENIANLISGKTLMDKNQFVNIKIIKLDQDEAELESIRCCNMEGEDGKVISMNNTPFKKDHFME